MKQLNTRAAAVALATLMMSAVPANVKAIVLESDESDLRGGIRYSY